jgi:putative glutamine transport system permease protein
LDAESASLMLSGLGITLWLVILSTALSLALGTLIGVMRVSPFAIISTFATGYVEFFRNIPLLIILFFVLNGLPQAGLTLSFFATGVAGLTVYTAAYVAEVVRAGLQSISVGQIEASRSLGLTWAQTMRYVLLPYTFRIVIPPLGTLFIALVKNTSLCSAVAVPEILYQAEVVEGRTFNPDIFLIAGLMYLLLTVPLSIIVNTIEQRFSLAQVAR